MAKSNHAANKHIAPDEINSPGKLASRFLQRSLKSVQRLLKVAAWDWQDDDEHVHQLRVSARRALAAMHFFQELIPDPDRRWFRKKLKAVLRKTREARELDVLTTEKLFACGKRERRLRKKWRSQRQDAQGSILAIQQKLARNHRFRKHSRHLKRKLESDESLTRVSGERWCCTRFEEICQQFAMADSDAFDPDALHQLRIKTKQFRYIVDVVEQATSLRKLEALKSALAAMQEQLGQIQDCIAAKALLQKSQQTTKKPRDRDNLRRSIDRMNHRISEQTALYRSWSKSRGGRKVAECLEVISEQVARDQAGR